VTAPAASARVPRTESFGSRRWAAEPARAPASAVRPARESWAFVLVAAAAFLVVALVTVAFHEFWRDEVRAFSLATETRSLAALFRELRYEGHPALWYLLLRGAHAIVPTTLVLPGVAIAVGVAAIVLFLRAAPFGRTEKLLFAFGLVPLYDHTVMARNYGIGMLALFAWAAAWPSRRERPWIAGLALACLANTHLPGLMAAGALLGAWCLELWQRRRDERVRAATWAALALVAVGIAAAVVTVRPAPDLGTVSPDAGSLVHRVVVALPKLVNPGGYFIDLLGITPDNVPRTTLLGRLVPYAAILVVDFFLLALVVAGWLQGGPFRLVLPAVLGGLTMLFAAIYRGSLRHQAVIVLLAIALEWVRRDQRARGETPDGARQRAGAALAGGALRALYVVLLVRGAWTIVDDVRGERSPIGRVAAWLDAQPPLARAVLVPEPAFYAEALPYYSRRHPMYLLRERRWGRWSSWARLADTTLTLGELLQQTRDLERTTGRPAVVMLGFPELLTEETSYERPGFGRFTWTPAERRAWNAEMELRQSFVGASTENMLLYTRRARTTR
jgi:hypothetical protein